MRLLAFLLMPYFLALSHAAPIAVEKREATASSSACVSPPSASSDVFDEAFDTPLFAVGTSTEDSGPSDAVNDGLADCDPQHAWRALASPSTPAWIQVSYRSTLLSVSGYAITFIGNNCATNNNNNNTTPGDDGKNTTGSIPTKSSTTSWAWLFQGSNDSVRWTTLDSNSVDVDEQGIATFQPEAALPSIATFRQFRWTFSPPSAPPSLIGGDTKAIIAVGELQLFGCWFTMDRQSLMTPTPVTAPPLSSNASFLQVRFQVQSIGHFAWPQRDTALAADFLAASDVVFGGEAIPTFTTDIGQVRRFRVELTSPKAQFQLHPPANGTAVLSVALTWCLIGHELAPLPGVTILPAFVPLRVAGQVVGNASDMVFFNSITSEQGIFNSTAAQFSSGIARDGSCIRLALTSTPITQAVTFESLVLETTLNPADLLIPADAVGKQRLFQPVTPSTVQVTYAVPLSEATNRRDAIITVQDTLPPVWDNCDTNRIIMLDPDVYEANVTWITPSSSDNVDVVQVTGDIKTWNSTRSSLSTSASEAWWVMVPAESPYTVRYSAVDAAGNEGVCTFTIRITYQASRVLNITLPFSAENFAPSVQQAPSGLTMYSLIMVPKLPNMLVDLAAYTRIDITWAAPGGDVITMNAPEESVAQLGMQFFFAVNDSVVALNDTDTSTTTTTTTTTPTPAPTTSTTIAPNFDATTMESPQAYGYASFAQLSHITPVNGSYAPNLFSDDPTQWLRLNTMISHNRIVVYGTSQAVILGGATFSAMTVSIIYPRGLPSLNKQHSYILVEDSNVRASQFWLENITQPVDPATRLGFLFTSDSEPPQWHNCSGNITMVVATGASAANVSWIVPTATDNRGVVSSTTTATPGMMVPLTYANPVNVTYAARDAAKLMGLCTFFIHVIDLEPPVIECPASMTSQNSSAVMNFRPVNVTDNSNATINVESTPAFGSRMFVGDNHVTMIARDASNNTASCTFTITILAVDVASSGSSAPTTAQWIGGGVAVGVFIIIVIIIIVKYMQHRARDTVREEILRIVGGLGICGACNKRLRELDRSEVTLLEQLGAGNFGSVHKGLFSQATGLQRSRFLVAVKMCHADAGPFARQALLEEATIMSQFENPHVLSIIGIVLDEPLMAVIEFMEYGALNLYLQRNASSITEPTRWLFAGQCAEGLRYLHSRSFVHRDVAARNVLLNSAMECKISDFGMSRTTEDGSYYRSKGGSLPVRWSAPESLEQQLFCEATDVWSYGVLLYEIWTNGEMPYKGWANSRVWVEVTSGYRLPPPSNCNPAVYDIMLRCWDSTLASRPHFQEMVDFFVCEAKPELMASGSIGTPATMSMSDSGNTSHGSGSGHGHGSGGGGSGASGGNHSGGSAKSEDPYVAVIGARGNTIRYREHMDMPGGDAADDAAQQQQPLVVMVDDPLSPATADGASPAADQTADATAAAVVGGGDGGGGGASTQPAKTKSWLPWRNRASFKATASPNAGRRSNLVPRNARMSEAHVATMAFPRMPDDSRYTDEVDAAPLRMFSMQEMSRERSPVPSRRPRASSDSPRVQVIATTVDFTRV